MPQGPRAAAACTPTTSCLITDVRPASGPLERGVYTGLRRAGGGRKPAWYAYAGGTGVSLSAPTRAGRATWHGGMAPSQALIVQGRRLGTRHWYRLLRLTSDADGRYRLSITFSGAAQYRTVWSGVRTSPKRTVQVR